MQINAARKKQTLNRGDGEGDKSSGIEAIEREMKEIDDNKNHNFEPNLQVELVIPTFFR